VRGMGGRREASPSMVAPGVADTTDGVGMVSRVVGGGWYILQNRVGVV